MSAAGLLLLAGIVLGFLLRGDRTLFGDLHVLEWVQRPEFPGLNMIVAAINAGGGSAGGITIAVLLMAIGIASRHPWYSAQVLLVVALRISGEVLKPLFRSPRPEMEYVRLPELILTTPGYPSGHTFTWTCVAGLLVVLALSLELRPAWRWTIIAVAALLPILGGFARVWIGVHWPYDVVGGFLFGSAAMMIMLAVLPIRKVRCLA